MRIVLTLLVLCLAFGCKKKEDAKPAPAEAQDPDPAAGDSPPPPAMAKRAGNCPSTVLGAVTAVEVKDKDVVVTITSEDKDAVLAIQKRAAELVAEKKGQPPAAGGGHDQKGTHGGGQGLCPVHVPEGATASAAPTDNGVAITITPKDNPDALKAEVETRIAKAADWVKDNIRLAEQGNQGGVGGGRGEHGANHSGEGDGKGVERKGQAPAGGEHGGDGGGKGTGGGEGKGTGGGGSKNKK
jgi:hypothetical protein